MMGRERLRALLPFLVFALALAVFVMYRVGWLAPVEGFLVRVTVPLQAGVSAVADRVGDLARAAGDLRSLRERNRELEAENARLLLEIVRLREVEHEGVLLRDLLGFVQAGPARDYLGASVVGRVVGHDPSNLQRYLILDVGSEAGIARSMPVATLEGLVGRISEVGIGWSRVLLIIDPSSSVNCLTQSTRASGLVQGLPDGSLSMRSIPLSDSISVGDTVFTSGLGGNFPPQLLVGQITGISRRDSDLYQEATVEPTVDFGRLEKVLVITDFQPMITPDTGALK